MAHDNSQSYQPSYSTRPTLRVDLPQIRINYEALKLKVGVAKIGASIKADAYGLGAVPVAKTLYGAGCRIFFVATAGEGKMVRDGVGPNAAIYVLNGPAPRDKGVLLGAKLKPVINSLEQAYYWADVSRGINEPPYTAIHIDTGMNRLGLSFDDVVELGRDKSMWSALNPEWVMSHLACASDAENPMNKTQLARFRKAAAQLPLTPLSLANTAGIYLGKPYHFQMVRPGIGLYGGVATNKPEQEIGRPVATLMAPILQVRWVKAGEPIGYNGSYIAPRDMRVAIVGAGYADGVPVRQSNTGTAILHDEEVAIVGRVSMDLTMIDATDANLSVEVGGVVIFRGEHLETEAREAGTINYELLVRLGQRCRRDYWKPKKKNLDA
jgi:alanine racemase